MQSIKQTMQKSSVFGKKSSTSYKLNPTFQTPDFKSRIQRQFINFYRREFNNMFRDWNIDFATGLFEVLLGFSLLLSFH